jgi:YidC/Oxa1 family membrane protein insertase
MIALFKTILLEPIFNLTVFIYMVLPGGDLGIAIIALTIITRVVLFPLTLKTIRSQRALNTLSPRVEEVKEKFKHDKTAQSAAIMQLYKENNVNPLSGCLPLLIQIPVLIALYRTFLSLSKGSGFDMLYSFISRPENINTNAFGLLDLALPSAVLAVAAGVFQYFQAKQSAMLQKTPGGSGQKQMAALQGQMLYFFPIMIIIISWNLPAGLTLYWVSATIFSILEQTYIKRRYI